MPSGSRALDADLPVVEVQAHLEGLGAGGPLSPHDHPHHVLRGHRESVGSVDRVAQGEAGRVVFLLGDGLGSIFARVDCSRTRPGAGASGPRSAARATRSAAITYFSMSAGESDSTSPLLSKP